MSEYAWRVEFAMKRFTCMKDLVCAGNVGGRGRRETQGYWSLASSPSEPESSPLSVWDRSAAAYNAFLSVLVLFLLPGLYHHSPACVFPQCSHDSLTAASFCSCADSHAPWPCPRGGRFTYSWRTRLLILRTPAHRLRKQVHGLLCELLRDAEG